MRGRENGPELSAKRNSGEEYKAILEEESLLCKAESWAGTYKARIIDKIQAAEKENNETEAEQYRMILRGINKELHHYPIDHEKLRRIIAEYPQKIKDLD